MTGAMMFGAFAGIACFVCVAFLNFGVAEVLAAAAVANAGFVFSTYKRNA